MEPYCTVRQESGSYPVWVGRGLLRELRALVEEAIPRRRIVLLMAEGIADSWGGAVRAGLGELGAEIIFSDTEKQKSLATTESILDRMIRGGVRRDWVAVVAGGGSAGDTGGFAASIFLRGIPYIHVPTTLLAQVDSSLGGKLGVNHSAGKNLIGVFAPPAAVIADQDTLATLPRRELRSGLFEALKAGVLGDAELFELMSEGYDSILERSGAFDQVVRRAIAVKAAIVTQDEREGDRRRLLNYGHTIGHGFEAATRYEVLTHGDAVAWGMIAANEIAVRRQLIEGSIRKRIDRSILAYGPDPLPMIDRDEVLAAVTHDKKFTSSGLIMALPVDAGRCISVEGITRSEVESGLDYALAASADYEARA